MKISFAGRSVHTSGIWSPWLRLMAGLCALALSLGSASAQSLATATIGGTANSTGSSNVGTGTFNSPYGIAVDSTGNVYVADTTNHIIRKISSTGTVSTLVGSPGAQASVDDNSAGAPAARFNNPRGIAINAAGDILYVADSSAGTIRRIGLSAAGGTVTGVTTIVATGTLSLPVGIAVDGSGNLYVADYGNNVIRKVVVSPFSMSVVAGTVSGTGSYVNGDGAAARFNGPIAVALNAASDTLYVADRDNNLIRRITGITGGTPTFTVSTYAGMPASSGTGPGTGGFADSATLTTAFFRSPSGVSVDSTGNVYVADTGNNAIRLISGTTVSTPVGPAATGIAGNTGSPGTAGPVEKTDGVGTAARFNQPFGIAVRTSVYIADQGNSLIRRAGAPSAPTVGSPTPDPQTALVGQNGVTFTATVGGFPAPTLQWERNPGGNTSFQTIIASGNYSGVNTNTLTINGVTLSMNNDTFRLTATSSQGGPVSSTFPARLIVNQAPAFSVGSVTFNAQVGQPLTGAAVVATGSNITYTAPTGSFGFGFRLNSDGTITGTPTSVSDAITNVTVTASNGVGTATQLVTINVLPPASTPVITQQPTDFTVPQNQTFANPAFYVVASANPAISGYQWQKRSSDLFTWNDLTNDGIYSNVTTHQLYINGISPAMNGEVFRVRVLNSQGVTDSNAVTLYVGQPPVITHSASYTFVVNQYSEFPLTATGVPTPTFSVFGGLPTGISYDPIGKKLVGSADPSAVNPGQYTLSITATNSAGTSNVQNFTLYVSTVGASAAISQQPGNATAQMGATVTFTATATGSPVPNVRWQRQANGTFNFADLFNDGTYSGTDTGSVSGSSVTSTLTITNVAPGMTGDQFRLVATNSVSGVAQSATSSPATLLVNAGTSISTFVGQSGFPGTNDGTGTSARFNTPASISTDVFGNFYVADQANHVIRKITPAGVVTTVAGLVGVSGNTDGVGTAARFSSPAAVVSDSIGNLYVADTYNHTIRLVTTTGTVTTVAGLAGNAGSVDGIGNAARFNFPSGLAIVGGSIYIADTSNHTIRRMLGSTVTTYAGTVGSPGSLNGNTTSARFNYPNGIVGDNAGNLYVADSFNHVIRRISNFGDVSTFAGLAGSAGSIDGNSSLARFNQPVGVAIDSSGNLYVADTFSHTIRKITPGADVTTLAGSPGLTGSSDGVGNSARFFGPLSVTVDSSGNVYIADTRNHSIRRTGSTSSPGISTQPQNRAAVVGGSTTFTVVATGVPSPSYQWQRQGAGNFGFVNLSNDGTYSGVNTATLSVNNIFPSSAGDQFRVVLSNGFGTPVTSEAATLTIGEAPIFTSGTGTSFRATDLGTFTVTATASPSPTFSLSNQPSWLTINPATGVLSGTPPADAVGTHTFTINATNGVLAQQTFTLTVTPAIQPPSISSQPASVSVSVGQTATFSVSVTGTEPFTYQWRRNGIAIPGATSSSLTLANVQLSAAGTYTVSITNAATTVNSNGADLVVNSAPVITQQPRTEIAQPGAVVSFSVSVIGGSSFNYQWRKNGLAIVGATNSTLTLSGVTAADVGNYDVQVSNALGLVTSSTAQLTVAAGNVAPVITAQPVSRTAIAGSSVTLSVSATGVPAVSYQWRKNGQNVPGATGRSFAFNPVQASDAGNYDVVVSNAVGAVTTSTAGLRVTSRSYAGYYFGGFGNSGNFALYVREDNTGVFLGYLPSAIAPVMSLNVTINDDGTFTFTQAAVNTSSEPGSPARAALLGVTTVSGTINSDGSLSGSLSGGAQLSINGTRSSDSGPTQGVAGFYTASAITGSAASYTIAGPGSQAFVVITTGTTTDGGLGNVNSNGSVSVATTRSTVTQTIGSTGTVSGSASGAISATLTGGSESAAARQRLVNISSRARVGGSNDVGIAGFVISGEESKTVLVRVVGPTLAQAPFNIAGALTAPKLEIYRGQVSLQTNQGIAANRAAIDAAGSLVGAFALGAAGNDAAILTTLAPGAYTAVASSANNTPGVALIEVYDLSAAVPGQKLLNISTRANAGANENTLIAGFVVPPGTAKRVLVRGVGPGLAAFGLTGTLPQPTLTLLNGSGGTVAQSTGLGTDSAAIAVASAQVGAFGLVSGDSAMIATLAPGNYTAQVSGAGGATGIALIEVYELP